jgi:4-hydroxybenzoate polyprenyltransferase
MLGQKLNYYIQLTRLNKPIGIYLLLWPTWWAIWIAAKGLPPLNIFIIFTLGVVIMRSAGCAINDYADRNFDGHVQRTKQRPLAAGFIQPKEAITVFAVLSLMALLLALPLNTLTLEFSVVALALAASYPFMKRFHHLPQLHLGAAFSWAIPMAFTAITNQWPPLSAWLLFCANLMWTVAYDTMYAMVDREDDLKIGVKSTAILFGQQDRLIVGILQSLTLILLISVGYMQHLNAWYYVGLGVATLLFIYQQGLIRQRIPSLCFKAFLNNHWVGFVIFLGIFLNYAFA